MNVIPDPRSLPIRRPGREPKPKKVRVVRRHEEDDLQAQIVEMFELRRVNDAICLAVPNGGKRDWRTAKLLKRTGVKAGTPDLIFLNVMGFTYFMENKAATGSLSKAQREFRDWCKTHNIPWVPRGRGGCSSPTLASSPSTPLPARFPACSIGSRGMVATGMN